MLHVFKGEILANMTQVSDVAPGPLVLIFNSVGLRMTEETFRCILLK
jgi:hypothetical protein